MTTDVTGILRGTDLLRSVPAEELEAVAAASRLRSFRRGQVLFTRSDPSDTVIVVISGRVKATVRSADGGELTLTIIPAGGMFGELGVADSGPRSGDAEGHFIRKDDDSTDDTEGHFIRKDDDSTDDTEGHFIR